jgi:hypothetical protein
MPDRFNELPGHIEKTLELLSGLLLKLERFEKELVPKIGKTEDSVLIPVQVLENGYTAIETMFMRISQAFENNLEQNRWHSDLLEKMTIEIKKARPRVISETTYGKLAELLRFRHFKRYYFEMNYDWRKIDLLITIFRETVPLLKTELTDFADKITKALE